MSDSVRSHRQQPTRLPHPWDSPGKNTGVGYHFLLQCMKVKCVTQSCLTPRDPMDCSSLPGSSSHGIFQARVLEWVPLPSSPYKTTAGIRPQGPNTPHTQSLTPPEHLSLLSTLSLYIGSFFVFHDTTLSLSFFLLFFMFFMKCFPCSTLQYCSYMSIASPSFSYLNGLNSDHDFL